MIPIFDHESLKKEVLHEFRKRYGLRPMIGKCTDCGKKLIANIPNLTSRGRPFLQSNPCTCARRIIFYVTNMAPPFYVAESVYIDENFLFHAHIAAITDIAERIWDKNEHC
jgi:hypothetical protein